MRGHIAASVIAVLALLAAACASGADAPPAPLRTDGSAAASATPVASPARDGWRAPERLPVEPRTYTYTVADPSFEALPGATAVFGELAGAGYRIEMPDNWNGDAVFFAHGFRGSAPELTVTDPPLREHFIARGYAWAASSYTKNGYEPGAGWRDTLALRDEFTRRFGEPRRAYIYGQSMGGHVVTLAMERSPEAWAGGLAECGVVAGVEVLDYFLSWGILAAHFSGTDLYSLTRDPAAFAEALRDDVVPALGTPREPTEAGRRFLSAGEQLSGGPRPFFAEGVDAQYVLNFAVLAGAVAAPGAANAAAQNADTVYAIDPALGVSADELNAAVRRVSADPAYRDTAALPEFAPMTGRLQAPLLTLHGSGDLFVPVSLEQSYARTVAAAGASRWLQQRTVDRAGHCAFTAEERIAAFADLVEWATR